MRDHYVGDVTDFLKFSLLRTLCDPHELGIAWYYIPGCDNSADGRHLDWLTSDGWQQFDPELHAWLSSVIDKNRSVKQLEDWSFWPGTRFHGDAVPNSIARSQWASSKREALKGAQVVFLDPDNGLKDRSRKHASLDEIALLNQFHRTVIFISFPNRMKKHDVQLSELHRMIRQRIGLQPIATLRTNVSIPTERDSRRCVQRQRWFTVIGINNNLISRLNDFSVRLNSIARVRSELTYSGVDPRLQLEA